MSHSRKKRIRNKSHGLDVTYMDDGRNIDRNRKDDNEPVMSVYQDERYGDVHGSQ